MQMSEPVKKPKHWVYKQPTPAQEFKKLMEQLDLDILKAYAKAGDSIAKEELKRVMQEKYK